MLGIVEYEYMYRKRDKNDNINFINKHLADDREAALEEQEDEPIAARFVALGVYENANQRFVACFASMDICGQEN